MCPGLHSRLANATRCDVFRVQKEYSYRASRAAGDGWVLVGDAFGFLDPLYSSGVLLALKSGQLAADAVAEGLARGDTSAAQLGKWEPDFARGMDRMRRLVCAFYDGFSFGRFIKQHPHLKGLLTDLLTLARYDAGVQPRPHEIVSLHPILTQLSERWQSQFAQAHLLTGQIDTDRFSDAGFGRIGRGDPHGTH